jgi:hypothetical protein
MQNMAIKRNLEEISKTFLELLTKNGEQGLYEYLRDTSYARFDSQPGLELEFIDTAEEFFSLYRVTGDENYFIIAKILRRVGHAVYRFSLKKDSQKKINKKKFLNLVK